MNYFGNFFFRIIRRISKRVDWRIFRDFSELFWAAPIFWGIKNFKRASQTNWLVQMGSKIFSEKVYAVSDRFRVFRESRKSITKFVDFECPQLYAIMISVHTNNDVIISSANSQLTFEFPLIPSPCQNTLICHANLKRAD